MNEKKKEEFTKALRNTRAFSNFAPKEETPQDEFQEALGGERSRVRLIQYQSEPEKSEFESMLDSVPLKPISDLYTQDSTIKTPQEAPLTLVATIPQTQEIAKETPPIPLNLSPTPEPTKEEPPPSTNLEEKLKDSPSDAPSTLSLSDIPGVITSNVAQSKIPAIPKSEEKGEPLKKKESRTPNIIVEASQLEVPKFEGRIPTPNEFVRLYHQLGVNGQNRAICSTVIDVLAKKSMLLYGPSASGKTTIGDVTYSLMPSDLGITFNDIQKGTLLEHPEHFNGKILYFPEIQTVLRGLGEEKDAVFTMFEGKPYIYSDKEGNQKIFHPLFAISAVAPTNAYYKNYIAKDPERKSRLNIIYTDSSLGSLLNHRNHENKKRNGMEQPNSDPLTNQRAATFLLNRMMAEVKGQVYDPGSSFVDAYFPLSHIANRYISHYRAAENALIKWNEEEDKYKVNGEEVHVLGLRNKYRAERILREDMCQAIREFPNLEYAQDMLNWSPEEIQALETSLKRSEEQVDWEAGWSSYLESLRAANAPPSLISEVINRHVVNGTITVEDPLTGDIVELAGHTDYTNKKTVIMPQTEHNSGLEGVVSSKGTGIKTTEPTDDESGICYEIERTQLKEPKPKHRLNNKKYEFSGNIYDSMEEAVCATLMQKYIADYEPVEGETLHIRGEGGILDFKVQDVFVEYHPILMSKSEKGFGDFPSTEAYEEYKTSKNSLSGQEKEEFEKAKRLDLASNYFTARSDLLSRLGHNASNLILATSAEELYDSVLSRFGKDLPDRESFLKEFWETKAQVKEANL